MDISNYKKVPKLPGIYKLVNTKNGKIYIGSSINMRNRIRTHNYELRNGIHVNKHLQRAYDKGSIFNIKLIDLFDEIDYNELLELEKRYIVSFDSIQNGYNQMLDSSNHFKKLNKTSEHKIKVKAQNAMPVISFDRYTGEKKKRFESVSDAALFYNTSSSNISRVCKGGLNHMKGHVFCYENDYDSNKNYSFPEYHAKGKKFSKIHRENLKKAAEKIKGIKVYKFDLNGNLVKTYPSRAEAERRNNMPKELLRWNDFTQTPFEGFFYRY